MTTKADEFRLLIAIPSGEYWHRLFGLSLAMTIGSLAGAPLPGYRVVDVKVDNHKGSILSRSRERLVENALRWKASHLLFVDSDMVFPADTVHRLMSHKKWVVAANCATKAIPASPTARKRAPGKVGGVPVYTDVKSTGLESVWRVGTGVMLLDMRVFLKIKKPWFPIRWVPELNDYMGEDWGFCEKLEEASMGIYVDHDLSKKIGHVGEYTYSHDVVGEIVQDKAVGA